MAVRIPKPAVPDEYLVDNRVYTDQRTFDLERERIFFRVWNFVCHESEIPNPGDFVTTIVGGQPIIVCRNKAGEIRAFYNTCRHRAAQVVFEKAWQQTQFHLPVSSVGLRSRRAASERARDRRLQDELLPRRP